MTPDTQLIENKNGTAKDESVMEVVEPARRPVPAPGRPGSFEEALKVGMKKYDNALRELAK